MKFQTRVILFYAAIAFTVSTIIGVVLYRMNLSNELSAQKNALISDSAQLIAQMDDKLGRMESLISYTVSDPDMLESITILGRASSEAVPGSFITTATATLNKKLNTKYNLENCYRICIFNTNGFSISSFHEVNRKRPVDISTLTYVPAPNEIEDQTVIIGPHEDSWGYPTDVAVYSILRSVGLYRTTYIEVENKIEDLSGLYSQNADDYILLINGSDILYCSNKDLDVPAILNAAQTLDGGEAANAGTQWIARSESEKYNIQAVAIRKLSPFSRELGDVLWVSVILMLGMFILSLLLLVVWSNYLQLPLKRLRRVIENTDLDNLDFYQTDKNEDLMLNEIEKLTDSYSRMTERLKIMMEKEKGSSMLQLQSQFDALQAQVNPHFIYNVLNIISARGVMDDDDLICDICEALANMLRYSTNNKERYAAVHQELEYLEQYVFLLKTRYGSKLQIEIIKDEKMLNKIIPKMAIQQLIENSMSHGFHDSETDMKILVEGTEDQNGWRIRVTDNGIGFGKDKLEYIRHRLEETKDSLQKRNKVLEMGIGGMGLINTYARCLLLYNDRLIFEINDLDQGAEVIIGEKYPLEV